MGDAPTHDGVLAFCFRFHLDNVQWPLEHQKAAAFVTAACEMVMDREIERRW